MYFVNVTIHVGDAVAQQAQNDLTTAYNDFALLAPTQDLTGQDLGGLTLAWAMQAGYVQLPP